MNRSMRWLLGVLVLIGVALGVWYTRPTEEKRIRKVIRGLAQDATFTGSEGNIARIAKIQSIGSRLTVDVELHLDQVLPIESAVTGRDAIQGLLMAGAPNAGAVEVQVHDVGVNLTSETEAQVSMTASAKTGGRKGEFTAQEFDIRMVKQEGAWRIRRVEAVAGFRQAR
jgi:hypothetical protein